LPYAAPPAGDRRWRPPQPPAAWTGIRDATQYGPSCPQKPSLFVPPGPQSEDCLYLNVSTSTLHHNARRPVLVWIHGGGITQDGALNYYGTKLAANGAVVVTINYRLGALGFLAHPALATRPGGPAGNYGLMDQQAALRWVEDNIGRFGGDPNNVTIAGQSAGGVSVLAQLVSPGARGLFQRATVKSGAFALNQVPLAAAEAFGTSFANEVNCQDQTSACLRKVPVDTLVNTPDGQSARCWHLTVPSRDPPGEQDREALLWRSHADNPRTNAAAGPAVSERRPSEPSLWVNQPGRSAECSGSAGTHSPGRSAS
jgi:para-nitrobenzyl esterase